MEKKKYIKPEIIEESRILTVRAWVTATQQVIAEETTQTSYTLNATLESVTQTSQSLQQVVTTTSVATQTLITQTSVALQVILSRSRRG